MAYPASPDQVSESVPSFSSVFHLFVVLELFLPILHLTLAFVPWSTWICTSSSVVLFAWRRLALLIVSVTTTVGVCQAWIQMSSYISGVSASNTVCVVAFHPVVSMRWLLVAYDPSLVLLAFHIHNHEIFHNRTLHLVPPFLFEHSFFPQGSWCEWKPPCVMLLELNCTKAGLWCIHNSAFYINYINMKIWFLEHNHTFLIRILLLI